MNDPFSLAGETALITGGGTGLGLGIARSFVQAGARIVLVGRRGDVLKRAALELGKAAEWEAHDILQLDQAGALVKRVWERVGPISILVNNAGIHIKKSAIDLTAVRNSLFSHAACAGRLGKTSVGSQRGRAKLDEFTAEAVSY